MTITLPRWMACVIQEIAFWWNSLRGPLLVIALGLFLVACNDSSTNANQNETQGQLTQQDIYAQEQSIPGFPYSNYRQALIQIEEQLATGSPTTWTEWESYSGVPEGVCKSWDWPLPVSTQLNNPQQAEWQDNGSNGTAGVAVGQQEPTGIYAPPSGLGTWVLCIGGDGQPHPSYIEGVVNTFPYPVDIQNGRVVQVGQASPDTAIKPCNPTTKTCPK